MGKYDSYKFRCGGQKLPKTEKELMNILIEFGESIDPQGFDGGDYDTAMQKILRIVFEGYHCIANAKQW